MCPQPRTVRSAIARFTGKGAPTALDAVDPRRAIAAAASLSPLHPAVLLWQFEVAVAYAEWAAAARSLRRARRYSAPEVAVSLARARLSEARGRTPAAQRILVRALARRRDPRLAESLASLGHGHGHAQNDF